MNQLGGGDFHVLYTQVEDEAGNVVFVPRIAIRMFEGEIAEIRGRMSDQNLEPVLQEVIDERLAQGDLEGASSYFQKLDNVRFLSSLHEKVFDLRQPITDIELLRVFSDPRELFTFGYDEDPRIEEIQWELIENPELWPQHIADVDDITEVYTLLFERRSSQVWGVKS